MFDCLFICLNYYFICLKPSHGWSYKFIYSWHIWKCCHFELAFSCSSLISQFYFKITLGISSFLFWLMIFFFFSSYAGRRRQCIGPALAEEEGWSPTAVVLWFYDHLSASALEFLFGDFNFLFCSNDHWLLQLVV